MKPRLNRNLRQNYECMLSVVLKTCSFYIIYLLWIVKQTFFLKKKDKACFFSLWLLLIVTITFSICWLQFFLSIMLWHFILTMTWKSTRLTHINATISRHDVLHPSEKSCAIVDDRVCLDLVLACDLFSTKVNGLYYRTFTNILSHPINGWANSMCTSSTTFCGAQARHQLHVGPFHRSLVFWAAWFAHVSASSMLQFCRWDTRHQVFIFQSVTAFHLLIEEILFTAYPATDVHFFTLLKLKEASGVVLGNVCEVYATTPLSFLWGNISTLRAQVFPMSRCVVWE